MRFIVLYQDANMKPSRISKLIGVSVRTIYDWINKIERDIDILEHRSKNFTSKLDQETRMEILEEVKEASGHTSTRRVGALYDVSHTTVRDVLITSGFQFKKPEKTHDLTEDEMEDRVNYCKDMVKYRGAKIKRCFFSDEMGLRLTDLYKGKKLWLLPGEEYHVEKAYEDVKVNCWGAISWNGATSLHIFSQNLTNPLYQEIVNEHKMEMENLFEKEHFFYQQDNHPCHKKLSVFDSSKNIEIEDFPTYSPDLNPIENLWATLKCRVAQDVPRTEGELVRSLEYNWSQITKAEILRPYLQTLEGRYRTCIEKKGERLPY